VKSRAVTAGKSQALSTMGQALANAESSGFRLRGGLPAVLELKRPCSEDELRTVLDATYRQLLNRVPTESERLIIAESRLRNEDIDLPDFIAEVAMSEAFQNRIASMAPLRAASAAGLALLGRATTPAETSRFLITRAQAGHGAAVTELLADRIGTEVPRVDGMNTTSGVPQATIQRTASLYSGNAGMNPPSGEAI
jgi:phycobilisome core-membrane linker protein